MMSFVFLLATLIRDCSFLLRDCSSISTDKDECETKEARCPQNSSCVNTAGSYRCKCDRGLQLQNNKCEGKICLFSGAQWKSFCHKKKKIDLLG